MIVSMQKVLWSQAKLAFILCILSFESDIGISFPFQEYWSGSQGSNLGLLHCRQTLDFYMSQQG